MMNAAALELERLAVELESFFSIERQAADAERRGECVNDMISDAHLGLQPIEMRGRRRPELRPRDRHSVDEFPTLAGGERFQRIPNPNSFTVRSDEVRPDARPVGCSRFVLDR